jgi:N-acetyl-anhydromuramyl-L-alanine amidase AmpD
MRSNIARVLICGPLIALLALGSCQDTTPIIVLDQEYPTSAVVVSFRDEGGYDAHQETCAFSPDQILPSRPSSGCNIPKRYSERGVSGLSESVAKAIAESGYDLERLRTRVDQVVLHFDVCGCSKQCFKVLHDVRGLSCHFLLDIDGTLYQTLDLTYRARHATKANDRSIGIEIAHMGAYPDQESLAKWYSKTDKGDIVYQLPRQLGDGGVRTPQFVARPARQELFQATINGQRVYQYDYTEEQYQALIALLPALQEVFPRIESRVPLDSNGLIQQDCMASEDYDSFRGVLGHYHVQRNKIDPGPAMDWSRIQNALRRDKPSP